MADALAAFAEQIQQALGARLVALLVYGSAARTSARSAGDVNTLLICDTIDEALYASLDQPLARWVRQGHEPPLIFTEQEWRDSSDVFAIEYDDLRAAHRVIAGRSPWDGVVVRREDIRRQLEAELRGKLVRLRQSAAAFRNNGKRLTQLVVGSSAGVFTMFRTLLRLVGRPVPERPEELVREAAAVVGFPGGALDDVAAHASGAKRLALEPRDSRAAAYLDAVARTTAYVDRLT